MALNIKACLLKANELSNISSSPRLDVELLLQHSLKKNRAYLYAWLDKILSDAEHDSFTALFQRRLAGEPIAYILGQHAFWSLDLKVSPCTLIPRPETESLVELALAHSHAESRILDLGTGTGAIALALASELPSASIHAVDSSSDAVELALENAKLNDIGNVSIYTSQWFAKVQGCFDIIISNPPYIEADDPHLQQGDVRFEPKSALTSGADGLDDIREICREAPNYLFEDGVLLLEHGWNQGERVRLELLKHGFSRVKTHCDLEQRERVTMGFWEG